MRRAALYLRVSTREQTVANQRPDLEQMARGRGFEIVETYEETVSGVADKRPEFERMLSAAHRHHFDALFVWSIDRLGRRMVDIIRTVQHLGDLGVGVASVRQSWLDSTGDGLARKILLAVFAGMAEYERDELIRRTHNGLARARAEGKTLGRPRVHVSRVELDQLIAAKLSPRAMAKRLHCSRASVYRQLAELGLATKAERRGYRLTNGGSKGGS